jgi:predicted enzyme related to lactoylglutathione lyase
MMITVDVPVADVAAAERFYREAFDLTAPGSDAAGGGRWLALTGVTLRICDRSTHVPNAADARYYQMGRVPRLELRVDDLEESLARAVRAGAVACARVPSEGALRYAQIIDPFGHKWSFALDG